MLPTRATTKNIAVVLPLIMPLNLAAVEKAPDELDEMVITATKTERSIRDVSATVTVIDRERIEKSNATTVDQLLKGVPGVYASRMDASSPNRIAQTYTRGLPGNGRTLVLIDDVPMNVSYDSQVDWSQLGTIDVDRVEVVRGAGSALYGNHAMGGVINVISKAITPGVKGKVDSEYGSMETIREAGIVSYGGEHSGGSVSTSYLESDGYNMWRPDTSVAAIPLSQRDKTGTRKTNVGAKFTHEFDASNLLDLSFSYLSDVATGLYRIPDYIAQDREQYLGSARYRYLGERSEATVVLYSRIGRMDADSANAANATSPDLARPGTMAASLISYRGDFDDMEAGIRAQYSHYIGSHHKLTVGGQHADSQMTMINQFPAERGREQLVEGGIQLSGIFLQDEINYGPLNVSLAGRWDLWQTDGQFRDTKTSFPGQGQWGNHAEDSFSPKGGFSYKLTDDLVLRGSIGQSFNTPDVSQLYGNSRRGGTTVAYGNPYLTPEKAVSGDIGLDYYFGRQGYIKTTIYNTTAEDFIATVQRSGATVGTTDKINIGTIRAEGVEVEGMWKLGDFLTLYASYTKNDSIVTKHDRNPNLIGKQLTNVPQDQGSLRADVSLPYGFSVFGAFNYVGDRYFTETNLPTAPGGSAVYKSYATYDLGVAKTLVKDVTARMTFMNIGNDKYEGIGYIAPGATIAGGISAKF
ncbi:TonB-dependent receptor [Methylomonas sp. BW4-1]|uniref:TonB-dependent receptor n=1 Tax=Methylomonas sp. BW4-1 TaxID=3376685 RepID=UPI00404341A7